jgi:hypothetical protein
MAKQEGSMFSESSKNFNIKTDNRQFLCSYSIKSALVAKRKRLSFVTAFEDLIELLHFVVVVPHVSDPFLTLPLLRKRKRFLARYLTRNLVAA